MTLLLASLCSTEELEAAQHSRSALEALAMKVGRVVPPSLCFDEPIVRREVLQALNISADEARILLKKSAGVDPNGPWYEVAPVIEE